jgi:hypothetical protein
VVWFLQENFFKTNTNNNNNSKLKNNCSKFDQLVVSSCDIPAWITVSVALIEKDKTVLSGLSRRSSGIIWPGGKNDLERNLTVLGCKKMENFKRSSEFLIKQLAS